MPDTQKNPLDDGELPRDSYTLIDLLNKAFPHRCILPGETPEAAHRRAGVRDLIDELMIWRDAEIEASRGGPDDAHS